MQVFKLLDVIALMICRQRGRVVKTYSRHSVDISLLITNGQK